ncbi:MAG: hypoxanthine phosphoribosyltransferase [Elusimicrobia bacterium RIFCSPLOWO2_01_FULL_64_13]|nr:MAG: hypoxanthine phosphoribosyltransferase [Elusimicrobia bacterium RIFCSPHIGHO2_01_FULL_64_10]OGR96690.1 MAG: hypoxanthine phosphoribosyltransferase [Elusimicrobia bacterium RIFCSPLOWO2_01_FULL_64_13]
MKPKVLIPAARIRRTVDRLAREISRDYRGKNLALVCVLKGSVVFLADLIRRLEIPCSIDFMAVSSYGKSRKSSGVARLVLDLRESPEGRDILLVEDILDTGRTVRYLLENLETRRPRSIKICALLDKAAGRKVPVRADYTGFRIPDRFVVGYGLDYAERYRQLPYIGALKGGSAAKVLRTARRKSEK